MKQELNRNKSRIKQDVNSWLYVSVQCEPGAYLDEALERCVWCPPKTYSAGGDIKCDLCPEGLITVNIANEGAKSIEECVKPG